MNGDDDLKKRAKKYAKKKPRRFDSPLPQVGIERMRLASEIRKPIPVKRRGDDSTGGGY